MSYIPVAQPPPDEGGLRPPPGLSFWRRVWWWFDFLILVKIARLRFVAILLVIGLVITQWDLLVAYYERWTRAAASADAADGDGGAFEWFCPMHPTIVRDNPKEKCPICFMPLSKRTKRAAGEAEPLPPGVVSRVQLSPYRVVLAGVNTWRVDYMPLSREIEAAGLVEFNERLQSTVPSRVNGRIDRLLVSETGQTVEKGDVLAEIYSPDLLVTVENLLRAQKAKNADMLRDSRTRLELLGIDAPQIDELLRSGQANTHLKIRSPISGHVIEKYVREGQYVQEGMALYDVADLSTVWIEAQIYEDDIALLPTAIDQQKLAVRATTRAYPNDEFHGTLSFIFPHVDELSRTLRVRLEIDNPEHKLRPGSTASVRLFIPPQQVPALDTVLTTDEQRVELARGRVLAVPQTAVIDTGEQKIVYRQRSPGEFEGVRVTLGPKMADADDVAFYPLLSGLAVGERIVTSGSFLVDAETRLNPAAGSIYFGGSGGGTGTPSAMVRPTTPEDPEAKIDTALGALPAADRDLARRQRFCAVLNDSRLGSMGTPIKLALEGEDVFLCCTGCGAAAMKDVTKTIQRAGELRGKGANGPQQRGP